jgi:hypothetical protein
VKPTVEIANPLSQQAKVLAAKEGLCSAVESKAKTASKPFRLREGIFRNGKGLQPGLKWVDLTTHAYQDETPILNPCLP